MYKKILLLFLLLIIYTFLCAISYVNAVSSDIQSNIFRLHIIANSNTDNDQNLKYTVRDNILKYINTISNKEASKQEIIKIVKNNINRIQEIAEKTIKKNGYNYQVKVNIGNYAFPTKKYGDISLPAGMYDALKIEIGEAEGQNWWCVMFPPLCFIDVTNGIVPEESKNIMKDNLSNEEYKLISESNTKINFKFKLIEMFQNINLEQI